MWRRFGALLRALFRKRRPDPPPAAGAPSPDEIRRLLVQRARLREAIASFRDFGYASLAREAAHHLAGVEARLRALPAEPVDESRDLP